MLHLLLPGTVLALAGGAWAAQRKRSAAKPPEITAKHKYIYESLINGSYSAKQYREASETFAKMGYSAESLMLEKRAQLKETPKEVKDARRAKFAEAMEKWHNVENIRGLAEKFDEIGATGAANELRKRADEIEKNSQPGDSRPITQTEEAAQ